MGPIFWPFCRFIFWSVVISQYGFAIKRLFSIGIQELCVAAKLLSSRCGNVTLLYLMARLHVARNRCHSRRNTRTSTNRDPGGNWYPCNTKPRAVYPSMVRGVQSTSDTLFTQHTRGDSDSQLGCP